MEFVKYCILEDQQSYSEFSLLTDLVKVLKSELGRHRGNEQGYYWEDILSLVIQRITRASKELDIFIQEYQIVQSLASYLCTKPELLNTS